MHETVRANESLGHVYILQSFNTCSNKPTGPLKTKRINAHSENELKGVIPTHSSLDGETILAPFPFDVFPTSQWGYGHLDL